MSPALKVRFAGLGVLVALVLTALITASISASTPLPAAETASSQPRPDSPTAPKLQRVIITFKTHFDIGYTDLAVNVVRRYRTEMMDQAPAVVDRSAGLPSDRRFVWMTPGWPMTKILEDWEGQTAERKERIWRAFRDGRFATHALPFTTHTEPLEIEDLVRGLRFSSDLARRGQLPLPRDAKMTDVPCHSWIMPTLLRHSGVEFLHLGCNSGSRSPEVPMLFWWEGPDGSRLLTMYIAEGYGSGLMPPANWPHKTWLALIHTGDNAGPPKPEQVEQVLQEAQKRLPGVQVRIGRLSDFADAIAADKEDLPVVRGDMPDSWIHGPMCDPTGARIARNIRPQIAACESLDTHLRTWGVALPDPREAIAKAYESGPRISAFGTKAPGLRACDCGRPTAATRRQRWSCRPPKPARRWPPLGPTGRPARCRRRGADWKSLRPARWCPLSARIPTVRGRSCDCGNPPAAPANATSACPKASGQRLPNVSISAANVSVPVPIQDGRFRATVRPFAPATFVLAAP